MLLQLFVLTGLRNENFPDPIQTDVLINFILEDLGNYTFQEFLLAFRMAIKNELEIDANHYQSFSAPYIARIMSGYSEIRADHLKSLRAAENALKIESKMEHTDAEKEEIKKGYILECIIKPWNYYKRTGGLTFGITPTSIIYNTLVEDLKIMQVDKDKKKEIYNQAKAIVKEDLERPVSDMVQYRRKQTLNERIEKEGFDKVMEVEIKSICYEKCLRDYFKECKENNIDLEQLILNQL